MKNYNILDFGAIAGQTCTAAIQKALDAASADCGATVIIPCGTFVTGTLNLGCASLYLQKGACLVGSPNKADYPFTGYDHNEMHSVYSLLYAMNAQDIHIYGEGTIDLNGDSFYNLDKRAIPACATPLTDAQIAECTATFDWRPNQPIFFVDCTHLKIENIRILNAPCWTLSFVGCQDVRIKDLTIDNNRVLPNNDGMHFCCCKGVVVTGCNISAGDDCIALSCITDWDDPCQDIVISDCILRSCSKAIVVGYMHSIVRNVTISNCTILDSNRALCIMSSAGSGLVENVAVSNLRLDTRVRAGNWWGNGEPVCVMGTYHHIDVYRDPIPQRQPHACIRNISFQNLICTGENAIAVVGENYSVENIHFDNIQMELLDSDNLAVKGRLIDISPSPQYATLPSEPTWLYVRSARGVTMTNAHIYPHNGVHPIAYITDCIDTHC